MTQKMSLASLGEQPNNGRGGQGGWRRRMWPGQPLSRAPGKDHIQGVQPRDTGLSPSRAAGGGDAAAALLSDGQAGV